MADFALWITAAEPALGWKPGTFLTTYKSNRNTANILILESSSVAKALQQLVEQEPWEGTATELLDKLTLLLPEKETKAKSWPKNPLALSNTLRRLAPSLRTAGFAIEFHKTAGKDSKRIISIRKETESSDASDAGDAPPNFAGENGDAQPTPSDATDNGATHGDAQPTPSDAKKPNENNYCDTCDARVALKHTYSKPSWKEDI